MANCFMEIGKEVQICYMECGTKGMSGQSEEVAEMLGR